LQWSDEELAKTWAMMLRQVDKKGLRKAA
jgi:hypothetical protein